MIWKTHNVCSNEEVSSRTTVLFVRAKKSADDDVSGRKSDRRLGEGRGLRWEREADPR